METKITESTPSRSKMLYQHVARKVSWLQELLMADVSSGKATAAMLRKNIGKAPGADPTVWDATLGDLPVGLQGWDDSPSFAESATHLALTLYAVHQQSQAKPMHVVGRGLGNAVRDFIGAGQGEEFESSPTIRRFNALVTSDSIDEMAWHLRSLVTQLRGAGISLDYAQLAVDLYSFNFPESRDGIRLKWGRQLYAWQRGE